MKLNFYYKGSWIKGILDLPKKKKTDKLVILVQGFNQVKEGPFNLFVATSHALAENGYAAYRFNYRFTDKTYNEYQKTTVAGQVEDLRFIFRKMKKKYKKIILVGESLGTVIVAASILKAYAFIFWYGFHTGEIFRKIFFTKKRLEILKREGYLEIRKSSGKKVKVGRKMIQELGKLNTFPYLKKINVPSLVMHGDLDTTLPISYGRRLYKILKGKKKLVVVKGANHGFGNRYYRFSPTIQKKAIKIAVDWLNKTIC